MSRENVEARVNDPLTMAAVGAGTWGDPSHPNHDEEFPAELAPAFYDYSEGMFVQTIPDDANAMPIIDPALLRVRTDADLRSYETPHEATHRRYEPPFTVPVNQAAAGFTLIAPPTGGLHYVKVLGCFLTLSAAGTLRFVQGSMDGTNVAAMTGNIALGGAATPPLQMPMSEIPNPWLFTAPDQALGIFTATGLAQGWVICCNSPYDA